MIEVIIDGKRHWAIPEDAWELSRVSAIGTHERDGQKRTLIELDKLPVGDYGRQYISVGDTVKIVRVQQDNPKDNQSLASRFNAVAGCAVAGGGGGGTGR